MTTMPIEKVAIVGATGRIGGAFAQALLKTGMHTVTALTRQDSEANVPDGAKIARVDYDDEASILKALEGQQFLVITLSVRAPADLHGRIAAAAGKAGVAYIMPNAFGNPVSLDGVKETEVMGKIMVERIKEAQNGTSSSITMPCGFWYEWSLALGEQWFGFTIKDRKVTFFDDGRRVITVSTWDQCGRALASLLSLPESGATPSLAQFKNKDVLISSFRVSQRDMLDSIHRVLGTSDADWEITYETCQKRIADGAAEMADGKFTGFAKMLYGGGFLPSNEQSDFAGKMKLANEDLGLPVEDLDEATQRAVDMLAGGWNPFPGETLL
ncbi:hypothetical protein N7452_000520 [Penicillium brevicompactum]|uniref:NmrA-like domain-containing protein n=1 Tax=Penicillium brevicompactum TaxID=5074 RepID=A0A9W9R0T3_PENBR|nr:hypothetical protein N7452_000520 [Penicillium brevicompactum]